MTSLDDRATASAFARLVGISQPAVSKHLHDGHLPRDGSMGEWLRAYCDHLRSYAAGRGGDNQGALTTARVEEAQAKTAMMRLNYAERLGKLVPADDAARIVVDWAGHTNREIRAAVEKLRQALESEHGITIAPETLTDVIEPAIERIGAFAEHAAGDLESGGGEVPAAQIGGDGAVAY